MMRALLWMRLNMPVRSGLIGFERSPTRLIGVLWLLAVGPFSAGCGSSDSHGFADGGGGGGPQVDMAHGGATIDPGIISKSSHSAEEAETHVAAAANGYVAVAYIGLQRGGGSTNGYRFSKDDGMTFEPADALDSPGGRVASDQPA